MSLNFDKLLSLIFEIQSFPGSIYIFLVFILLSFYNFTIKIFFVLQREGFNKESSLDTVLIADSILVVSFLFIRDFSLESIAFFVDSYLFLVSFIFVFLLLYVKAIFSHWSFFKLLDVFSLYGSAFYGYILVVLSFFTKSPKIAFLGLLFIVFYKVLKKPYKEKYNSAFLFFKLTKNYELTLIGFCFYFFLIYFSFFTSLLSVIFDKPISLVLLFSNSVIIIFAFIKVIRITKFFGLKWNYSLNLLKNKNNFFWIRRKKLISRLND